MQETTYTLTITAKQAAIISEACDLLSRLGIGQWPEFIRKLPGRGAIDHAYELEDELRPIMATWFGRHPIGERKTVINGWQSHLGIGNHDATQESSVAFDLHQVIRHRLAVDRLEANRARGRYEMTRYPESRYLSEPMHYGTEPLARMEKAT